MFLHFDNVDLQLVSYYLLHILLIHQYLLFTRHTRMGFRLPGILKPSIFKRSGCAKGIPCSICWRGNEAVCDINFFVKPTIVSRIAESS
ncbi:transmembrane protein, putative [Medicago truncatula]|uniref:Transmembrane protein, putative n=1 Tax=Medicago truncatula TaxID=3880 RepID=A0A072UL54_MEDTR|nr:transmembrane protein, putative [Medicago truncatula]